MGNIQILDSFIRVDIKILKQGIREAETHNVLSFLNIYFKEIYCRIENKQRIENIRYYKRMF